jgi:hypothetical protein
MSAMFQTGNAATLCFLLFTSVSGASLGATMAGAMTPAHTGDGKADLDFEANLWWRGHASCRNFNFCA